MGEEPKPCTPPQDQQIKTQTADRGMEQIWHHRSSREQLPSSSKAILCYGSVWRNEPSQDLDRQTLRVGWGTTGTLFRTQPGRALCTSEAVHATPIKEYQSTAVKEKVWKTWVWVREPFNITIIIFTWVKFGWGEEKRKKIPPIKQ